MRSSRVHSAITFDQSNLNWVIVHVIAFSLKLTDQFRSSVVTAHWFLHSRWLARARQSSREFINSCSRSRHFNLRNDLLDFQHTVQLNWNVKLLSTMQAHSEALRISMLFRVKLLLSKNFKQKRLNQKS